MAADDRRDRPKAKSPRSLATLIPFLRPYRLTLAGAFCALALSSLALLSLPVAVRMLIDTGFDPQASRRLTLWFSGVFLIAAAYGGFAALRYYLVTRLGERVVADLRDAVYRRVIRMDPAFFETTRIGEVQSRLTTDTTLIESISGSGLSIVLRSSLNLVAGLIMLLLTSPRLTGLTMLLFPVVIVPLMLLGRRVRDTSRAAQDRIADTSAMAGESLNAVQIVQAFTLEPLLAHRYHEAVEAGFAAALRRIRVRALLMSSIITVVFGAIVFVLWMGAQSVMAGTMTAGELGQFLLYALFVAGSAAALSELWGEVQRAGGAMERLSELLAAEPTVAAPEQPLLLPDPPQGSVAFQGVSFSYPSRPETRALEDFSLDVAPGEHVAFVGPSGAGKSTTFQLLLRFFDPQAGRILIDGVDVARADPTQVRQRLGLVPQDTVVFGASALENIRYGRPEASDEEVRHAAVAAAADEFIRQLPDGYDTFLGERGMRLSGGQRQRIAIARAILKDPPILLLDEATSSLDAQSEHLVHAALDRLMARRTTVIIAHRLSTVLRCDRIVFIRQGRIEDVGTHEELLARNADYAHLASLHFAAPRRAAISA
jgi:ATP-binding cassette subfamily B protein